MVRNREKRPYQVPVYDELDQPRFSRNILFWGWPLNRQAAVFVVVWFFGAFFVYTLPLVTIISIALDRYEIIAGIAIVTWFVCVAIHLVKYASRVSEFSRRSPDENVSTVWPSGH